MNSALTLLCSVTTTHVLSDLSGTTTPSFSHRCNSVIWGKACREQSSAPFSASETYCWANSDFREGSPDASTISLIVNESAGKGSFYSRVFKITEDIS